MPIKFSFIIASVDRDAQLQDCIDSIEKAHIHRLDVPIEIIVVIQKAKKKKETKVRFPQLTAFYYIDKVGLSAARNFAIEKSNGDYLIFLDDDAAVSEDFIDALSSEINAYPRNNAFCGRLLVPSNRAPFSRLFYNIANKRLRKIDYQYFMGSAHVLSRNVINKVGNYDERFGIGAKYYGSEETDIFFRLKAAGEDVLYLPSLVFYHPIPESPDDYVYRYAYALAAMLTKNCIINKSSAHVYCYIAAERTVKSTVRLLQKAALKGKYIEKDSRYHYASVLRGTFAGIRDFIRNEL